MLRTHRAGKGPGSCGGVGLRLKEQKGPRCAPHPWSQRAGDFTWESSRLPGLKWAGQMPSSPLLSFSSLGGPLLPASPDLPSLPPIPPRTHAACRGLWRARDWSGSSAGSLGLNGQGNHPPLLSQSSQMAPPTCLC